MLREFINLDDFLEFDKYKTPIPKAERKTLLMISDDMFTPSGVANVSKNIILKTAHHFNWVQLASMQNHPKQGNIFNLDEELKTQFGIEDASVTLIPISGFGDERTINQILEMFNISGILFITDPKYFVWLFEIEHQLRTRVPLLYYHVWDNIPNPKYNKSFYESCDYIASISKLTHSIIKNTISPELLRDLYLTYIPHGVDEKVFFKIDETDEDYKKFKSDFLKTEDELFTVLYNSRNQNRKRTTVLLEAFGKFLKMPNVDVDKCKLILHTDMFPANPDGTNLYACIEDVYTDIKGKYIETNGIMDQKLINYLYNIADVTVSTSNAEGFGLGTLESMMAETPIIANITGGLQDQFNFIDENENPLTVDKYTETFQTNSIRKYERQSSVVGVPVFPKLTWSFGSILTPYINNDEVSSDDIADAIYLMYTIGKHGRDQMGKDGRESALGFIKGMYADNMAYRFMKTIDEFLTLWKPKSKFKIFKG